MRTLSATLLLCAPLLAQSVPLPDGDVLQLYDVHDLIQPTDGETSDEGAEDRDRSKGPLEGLAAFARTFVRPPLEGDQDIAALGRSTLVVRANAVQHAWVAHVLATRRRAHNAQIELDLRVLTVPERPFMKHFAPLLAGPPFAQESAVRDAGEATETWLGDVLGDESIQSLTAPRLLVLPLQQAEITTGNEFSYVKDYEVKFVAERAVATPIIDTLFDGVQIEATAGPVGGNAIGVSLHFAQQAVTRPIPTFTTSLAGRDEEITIDLPEWRRTELRQQIVVPDGGLALAVTNDGEDFAVVLVRAAMRR